MKKFAVVVMMVAVATSAMAGTLAQTAAPIDVGALNANAGIVMGLNEDNDSMAVVGRVTYGAIEDLLVSAEIGYETDAEIIPLSLAVQYALSMLDLPVDLAVRLDLTMPSLEDAGDMMTLTPALVVSAAIEQVTGLALYAAVGMTMFMGDVYEDVDPEVVIGGGATYDLPVEGLGVFVELMLWLGDSEMMTLGAGLSYAIM